MFTVDEWNRRDESALTQAEERGRLAGLLVEAAEKVSANVVDGQSMRVSIEDLIALKDTVAALDKEQSCS
jgi:hypothetical protein